MRIAIASLGSRGDVQPMAALAAGLARRGHAVSLIAPLGYASLINEPGVELRAIDYDVRAELPYRQADMADSLLGSQSYPGGAARTGRSQGLRAP